MATNGSFNEFSNTNSGLNEAIQRAFIEHISELFYEASGDTTGDAPTAASDELILSDAELADIEKGIIPHKFTLKGGTIDVSSTVITNGSYKGQTIPKSKGKFRSSKVKGHLLLRFKSEEGQVAYEYSADYGSLHNHKGGGIYEDIMSIVERKFKKNIP